MADHEDQDLPAAEQEPLLGGAGIPFIGGTDTAQRTAD